MNFESDLVKLYTEVRSLMAEKYDRNNFGPVIKTEIGDDLSTEELAKQKAAVAEEQKLIKIGYQRIKQKIKDLQQDYSNAVTVGRRSGSGKLLEDNWEILKNIWGGSAAVINLRNARFSLQNQLSDKKDNESGNMNAENVSGMKVNNWTVTLKSQLLKNQWRISTPKFLDSKRKMLEKIYQQTEEIKSI